MKVLVLVITFFIGFLSSKVNYDLSPFFINSDSFNNVSGVDVQAEREKYNDSLLSTEENQSNKTDQVKFNDKKDALPIMDIDKKKQYSSSSDFMKKVSLEKVAAWIYPGNPTCDSLEEAADGRDIDILKAEFFKIGDNGSFTLMTEDEFGCNGFSTTTVDALKQLSDEQYVTISSSYARDMDAFFLSPDYQKNVLQIYSLIVNNNFTGVELDFEDFGGWTDTSYTLFLKFVDDLGVLLHQKGKKLIVDVPPVRNEVEEQWYKLRLYDLFNHDVDGVVVMAYDYQFDQGPGNPIAPLKWIQGVSIFTQKRFPNKKAISIGLPSYGYKWDARTNRILIKTYEQIKKEPGFFSAKRMESSELTWRHNENIYVFQDSQSLKNKVRTVLETGIGNISIWHLGGNKWFR